MGKIKGNWKNVVAINMVWLAWYMVYLFIWIPIDKTPASLEGFWYGLSLIPFVILLVLGIGGIVDLISPSKRRENG